MNEILLTGLAVAVIVMIVLDVIEKIGDYRINKIEERRRQAEEEMAKAYKPPTIHTVHHDIITLNVKGVIPREVIIMHDDKFVSEEICEKLATEIMTKNLVNLRTFSSFENGAYCYEATLRVVDPTGGIENVEEE